MPMDYDSRLHGPVNWPMPFPGVWLRQAENADVETYWQLEDGQLVASAYVRTRPADALDSFVDDKGRELVWIDVADPPVSQRLFAINADATMTPLGQWRCRL